MLVESYTFCVCLLPGEYAVLGLLALGPRHGYELARILTEELAAVCAVVGPGQTGSHCLKVQAPQEQGDQQWKDK